jgi:hypothetical protein
VDIFLFAFELMMHRNHHHETPSTVAFHRVFDACCRRTFGLLTAITAAEKGFVIVLIVFSPLMDVLAWTPEAGRD